MTTYIWAIDTPWAKKGDKYTGSFIQLERFGTKPIYFFNQREEDKMIHLGWIKPVEDKKLTEEEILEAICFNVGQMNGVHLDIRKLSKFLAEHLKN